MVLDRSGVFSNSANVVLLRDIGVAVEDEAGAVRVRAHFVPEEPLADFDAGDVGVLLVTHVVHAVAGRAEDVRGESGFIVAHLSEEDWLHDCVVVDRVIERAVAAIVHVDGLGSCCGVTTSASVNLCGKVTGVGDKVAAWLGNELHLDGAEVFIDTRLDGVSKLDKCREAASS